MKPPNERHEYDFRPRVTLDTYRRIMRIAAERDVQPNVLVRELIHLGLAIAENRQRVWPAEKQETRVESSL